jgi:hypothetical protein
MTPAERLQRQLVAAMKRHLATGRPVLVPEAGRLLWSIFSGLSAMRTYHMDGPNPISAAETAAYARLHRWPLSESHLAIIRALDDTWLSHAYAKQGGKGDIPVSRRSSGQKITAAAFDAVFG